MSRNAGKPGLINNALSTPRGSSNNPGSASMTSRGGKHISGSSTENSEIREDNLKSIANRSSAVSGSTSSINHGNSFTDGFKGEGSPRKTERSEKILFLFNFFHFEICYVSSHQRI